MPRNSCSANLKPTLLLSSPSYWAWLFLVLRSDMICWATAASSSVGFGIATITTWMGAILGGRTRPSAFEWVITSAPINLVDTHQQVDRTYSSWFSSLENLTS